MVTGCAANSRAAWIRTCDSLFLAGETDLAVPRIWGHGNHSRPRSPRARFGARKKERIAGRLRPLCLHAESALPGVVADRHRLRDRITQLVDWSRADCDVLRDLSAGHPRRGSFSQGEVP